MTIWTNIMAILGVVGMCVTFNDTATFGKIAAFCAVRHRRRDPLASQERAAAMNPPILPGPQR